MRKIEYTKKFKRESKGKHKTSLKKIFPEILNSLVNDVELAEKFRDHALTGDWKDHRDCHIKPDLVLLYRKQDKRSLQLVRIGSHSV